MTTTTSQRYGVDNLTYEFVTIISQKSKGLGAYDQYLDDAQGNQQVTSLFQQLRQQDEQAIQQLVQQLKQTLR